MGPEGYLGRYRKLKPTAGEVILGEDDGSAITVVDAPYGEYIAGPLFDQAGILTAELDLDQIIQSKLDWDPVGHYNRPEILNL